MKLIVGEWYKFRYADERSFIKYHHKSSGRIYFTESVNDGCYDNYKDHQDGVDWWDDYGVSISIADLSELLEYLPKDYVFNQIIEIY